MNPHTGGIAQSVERASRQLQQILELLLQQGSGSLERADTFVELGELYLKLDDHEGARRCFQLGVNQYQSLGVPPGTELLERLNQIP